MVFNGKEKVFNFYPFRIYRKYSIAELSDMICDGDLLTYEPVVPRLKIKNVLTQENIELNDGEIKVFVNGEAVLVKGQGSRILKNGIRVQTNETVEDGDKMEVVRDSEIAPIFVVIKPPSVTALFKRYLNGRETQFKAPIKMGIKFVYFGRI